MIEIARRQLLPWWIKACCWIFMFMGAIALLGLIFGAFGGAANFSIYGFKTNNPLSITGLFVIIVMAFKGFSAYSLWFEKDNAILIGKIDAVSGIVICVISMFVVPFIEETSTFTLRIEIALLIPFYLKLDKMEYEWSYPEKKM